MGNGRWEMTVLTGRLQFLPAVRPQNIHQIHVNSCQRGCSVIPPVWIIYC